MSAINILCKGVPGREYVVTDMIATRLSRAQFEKLQALNPELLGDYRFTPQAETDFSWWPRISRKLTPRKIVTAYFNCDFYGRVTEEI